MFVQSIEEKFPIRLIDNISVHIDTAILELAQNTIGEYQAKAYQKNYSFIEFKINYFFKIIISVADKYWVKIGTESSKTSIFPPNISKSS